MPKPHLRGRNKEVNPLLGEPMDEGTEAQKRDREGHILVQRAESEGDHRCPEF